MPYYAHIRQDENGETIYQTVAEHLTGTAALCREFAADFGAEADGDLMGLAHDLGKCTDAFQKRLLEGGPVVDHTTAGMLTCIRMKRPSAAACVAGHHGGLLDVGNLRTDRAGEATLSGRFKKGVEGHYLERCGESGVTLPTLPPETPERDPLKASFRTRMLYSCLVDADFLDTERFMDGERGRGGYDDLPTLLRRLKEYIAPWQNPKTALNKLRCKILNSCLDTGSKPKGIYTLTVPTGGGKTVASLAFALRHAVAHGMKRVIYVVPYTSIIEQNAEVFREILGDGNVLEHHSGVQFELSDGASPEEVRRALAAENWDMPVIVTTAVQFFESIYANRSSKCRKLHNLADSVIIFDEAQMLPLCHLRPCVAAMASLAEQFRSTLARRQFRAAPELRGKFPRAEIRHAVTLPLFQPSLDNVLKLAGIVAGRSGVRHVEVRVDDIVYISQHHSRALLNALRRGEVQFPLPFFHHGLCPAGADDILDLVAADVGEADGCAHMDAVDHPTEPWVPVDAFQQPARC